MSQFMSQPNAIAGNRVTLPGSTGSPAGDNSAATSIPAIDIAGFHTGGQRARASMAEAIACACRDIGFFHVRGHRVGHRLITAMEQATAALFRLPDDDKHALCARPGDYRGYIPLAAFGDNASTSAADHYEGFKLHREVAGDDPIRRSCDLYGSNLWPVQLPGFRDAVLAYWRAMDALGEELLRLFAIALGIDERRLLPYFENPLTNMTLLRYPPLDRPRTGAGIHPHHDIDAFTIVHPGKVPGLEVLTRAGRWVDIAPVEGALLVNVGNMMELWSGGRFVSTPHRVTSPVGTERLSFPYFAIPRHDVRVEPLVPRVKGFDRPAIEAGFILRELYRTNWASVAQTDLSVDTGTVA